ncbi:MAG: hypothetical protein WD076_10095, partial [Parvularculaceae bacterium]
VAHLKTHPYVAARLAVGRTRIHAWVYDIETGAVLAYDEAAGRFVPVADYYGDAAGATVSASVSRRKNRKK